MTRHHPLWLRKFLAISSAACMTMLALSACGTGSSAPSSAPITIGVSISTSGDFSADGTALQQGYQLWADGVNAHGGLLGRKVKLDIVGDNSTPTQVTTNYQKLITLDKVDLVVGPFSSELTGPAALVANRYGDVLIEGSGGAPAIFAAGLTNVFDVSSPVEDNLVSFTTFLKGLPAGAQPLTVAYMTADDPFTQPQIAKAKQILEAAGFKTVYYQVYPTETADFTPIAQGVINSHADIVIGGTGVPDSEAFVTAFKQQHFNPKALIFTSGPDSGATFSQAVGSANTEGILFPNGWWPGLNTSLNTAFTQAFVAKYGGNANDISADSVEAYSVGEVLQQAVTDCHCTDSKTIEQTLHTKSFTTAQGPVQFDAVGENPALPVLLFQWQHGTVVSVYPSASATASMEYPKPAWGS